MNIAHRGGGGLLPENTVLAFEHALGLGVDGIECDLQLSRDGHLVVHHDLRLKADATRRDGKWLTASGAPIATLDLDELRKYDVGRLKSDSVYAARHNRRQMRDNVEIPTFDELCGLIRISRPRDFTLFAELKTAMDGDAAAPQALAAGFIEAARASGILAQIIAISFDWRVLTYIKAHAPEIKCGFTTVPFALSDPQGLSAAKDSQEEAKIRMASRHGAAWWAGYDWRDIDASRAKTHGLAVLHALALAAKTDILWCGYWRDMSRETLRYIDDLGGRALAWTVNEAQDMRALIALAQQDNLPLAGLITDYPDILGDILR